MRHEKAYQAWLSSDYISEAVKRELEGLSQSEIVDRFYKDLEFGTGGLRGVIGYGSNRINEYTIRKATRGLAAYLLAGSKEIKKVAIAYDSRHMSKEFAREAAHTLADNNIKVYLYEDIRTTPQLSFTVRHLNCDAGIVITASHNPKEYNGYKVYGSDGGQVTDIPAKQIIEYVNRINVLAEGNTTCYEELIRDNKIELIGQKIDDLYIKRVLDLSNDQSEKKIKVLFTPLHGTGLMPIQACADRLGYENFIVFEEQAVPDGAFPTVKSPNPEDIEALQPALTKAKGLGAHLVLATDPDCDRVGVAVYTGGKYELINGNQIGALLINYLLTTRKDIPENATVIKTIVTSDLGAEIARANGLKVESTLTGFKYIGEKIKEYETNDSNSFYFGYEESYGYLFDTFVRDKDAVIASMLVIEMASHYYDMGIDIPQVLEEIYAKYGYYIESLETLTLKGKEGADQISMLMNKLNDIRILKKYFSELNSVELYKTSTSLSLLTGKESSLDLPQSNVVKLLFNDLSWIAARPSGTEPKMKFYYSVKSDDNFGANHKMRILKEMISKFKTDMIK